VAERPQRILVATPEVVGVLRAGPAVRAWNFAAALAADPVGHSVTLAGRLEAGPPPAASFAITELEEAANEQFVASQDVVIVQGDLLTRFPALGATSAILVADLYDPFPLEVIEQTSMLEPDHRRRSVWAANRALEGLLRRGDHFLCAGGRQRDFWLGALVALGRFNEATHSAAPDLRTLLADVPFGVDDEPPKHDREVLRGVLPGIEAADTVLWWGGGLYAWLDPITLVDAVARLVPDHPQVRLVFAGAKHPNPDVGVTPAAAAAREHATQLGLFGHNVFFLDWVPYDERGSYLLESDIVVSTHHHHLETAFSYRTRILDALWAARPVVTTRGDVLGEEVERRGAGIAVPAEDVDGLVEALKQLIDDPQRRAACAAAAGRFGDEQRWSIILAPLLEFCRHPAPAPDRRDPLIAPMIRDPNAQPPTAPIRTRARRLIARTVGRLGDRSPS
jgi:glycosyltransferase involved in cell wall biosynthesis